MEHHHAHSNGNIDHIHSTTQSLLPSKRKRQAPDIVWTAKRCQRLLRSITSRLRILRNIHTSNEICQTVRNDVPDDKESTTIPDTPASEQSSPTSPTSPEWLPGGTGKATMTYGRRKRGVEFSNADHAVKHGAVAFPTPLLMKLLNPELHSPLMLKSYPSLPCRSRNLKNSRRPLMLPVRPANSMEEAHRNLLAAFETFLNNTKAPAEIPPRGASTLVNMALRRASQYMEQEESISKTLAEEDNNAADPVSEIYTELENLGCKEGGGWRGLRQLIRAHCLRHIERAILDGILPQHIVRILLDLCGKYDAVREGHQIIEAYLQTDSSVDGKRTFLLDMASYCIQHGGEAFWLKCITVLLHERAIMPEELSRNTTVWRIFIRLITTNDANVAESFLSAYMVNLAGLNPGSARSVPLRRLQDALSVLVAMALSSDRPDGVCSQVMITSMVDRITRAKCMDTPASFPSKILTPLVNACLLLRCLLPGTNSSCASVDIGSLVELRSQLTVKQDERKNTTSPTAAFACGVAQIVEDMQDGFGTVLMRRIVSAVSQRAGLCEPPLTRKALRDLALDCTLSYAGTSEDQQCIDVARGVGLVMTSSHTGEVVEIPEQLDTNFRWEEGLCEWIQATPAPRHRVNKHRREESSDESSSEIESIRSLKQIDTHTDLGHDTKATDEDNNNNTNHPRRARTDVLKDSLAGSKNSSSERSLGRRRICTKRDTSRSLAHLDPNIPRRVRPATQKGATLYPPRKENMSHEFEDRSSEVVDNQPMVETEDDDDELALISPVKKRRVMFSRLPTPKERRDPVPTEARRMLAAACDDSDDELGL